MNSQILNVSYRLIFATVILSLCGCVSIQKPNIEKLSYQKLEKFESKKDFDIYIESVKKINDYRHAKYLSEQDYLIDSEGSRKVTITGSRVSSKDTSLTNNQVSGVDEGDIVKRKGDFLLILRRGKIYSVSIRSKNQNTLTPISSVDVTPPGWKFDSWYDEMLIAGNKILVLGYSYDLEASEILRFEITDDGMLTYQDGFLLSSGDYFDAESYASRLFKGKYITYMPSPLTTYDDEYGSSREFKTGLPRIAKIEGNKREALQWTNLISYKNISKPLQSVLEPVLHTILTCDPLSEKFTCDAKGIIASSATEYYVDHDAIYLWTQAWNEELLFDIDFESDLDFWSLDDHQLKYVKDLEAMVFRISLSNESITTMKVNGQPVNQFSFYTKGDSLFMYLIDDVDVDERMHSSLYKLPISQFNTEGSNQAEKIADMPHTYLEVNNRFSNDFLVTGSVSNLSWKRNAGRYLNPDFDLIVQKIDGEFQRVITLEHSADRLEPIGSLMFVSGLDLEGNYNVTLLDVENYGEVISRKIFPSLLEDELRSHAFNFTKINDTLTLIGLTSLNKKDARKRYGDFNYHWRDNQAADIFFLGLDSQGQLLESGTLKSKLSNIPDLEGCETSCYDWYGNSRPFFIGDRIFGLSGDELIEAELEGVTVNGIARKDIRVVN